MLTFIETYYGIMVYFTRATRGYGITAPSIRGTVKFETPDGYVTRTLLPMLPTGR